MSAESLADEANVFYCRPDDIRSEDKRLAYESVLANDELERYHRFHFESDRHSYLVSHALLRHSLSKFHSTEPAAWKFQQNEHGKPSLASPGQNLRFNLTHTDGLCACVITDGVTTGIDAENIHRQNNLPALSQRMFAAEEISLLLDESMPRQFFYYWTLREAYVKATGTGLSGSSKEFYFDVDTEKMKAGLLHRDNAETVDGGWQFRLYEPTAEHVLSIALETSREMPIHVEEFIP